MIKLIVGLGNPGKEYENTFHNVGALALAAIEEHFKVLHEKPPFKTLHPEVFMNESGRPVAEAAKMSALKPDEILILHDESDLPLGEFKYSFGGGSAGHNGIKSIADHLHTTEFGRIRIGIRDPKEQVRKKAGDFVLSPISSHNKKILAGVFVEIEKKLAAI